MIFTTQAMQRSLLTNLYLRVAIGLSRIDNEKLV